MRFHLAAITGLGVLLGCAPGQGMQDDPATVAGTSSAAPAPQDHDPHVGLDRAHASVIASLPDRGELLEYDRSRKVIRVGAATFHPVTVSEQYALNAITSRQLAFTTPDGALIRLTYMERFEHPGDRWTWLGRGSDGAIAALTFGVNDISGKIPVPGGKSLLLGTSAEGAWLATTKGDVMTPEVRGPFEIGPTVDPMVFMQSSGTFAGMGFAAGPRTKSEGANTASTPRSKRMARHDVDGDGRADILWTVGGIEPTKHLSVWFMQGSTLTGGRYFEHANPAFTDPNGLGAIRGVSDLDGSGTADLFYHQFHRVDPMYFVSVAGPDFAQLQVRKFEPNYPHRYPADWSVAGILDMNGDGKSDIGWREDLPRCTPDTPRDQYLSRWYLDAGVLQGGRLDRLGYCTGLQSFGVSSPGDFDGNGLGDFLVFTSNTTVQILLTASDGSPMASGRELPILPNWVPLGSGDLNGDGQADLVFRETNRDVPSVLHIWFMDGGAVIGSKSETLPRSWNKHLVIADFDGNGYDDLLWTGVDAYSSGVGHALMWRMQPSGVFEGSYVGSYPLEWRVVNSNY